ncbi:Undecaprenyl-diphosphatase [Fusobacterium sp. DD29]|uniref:undecaprenyl-diphosphate phosphatase n=1 Tax=unclassified Fusobacterium TaxID=2648384 RepID=UPI001B8C35C9|nr:MULTISPECIES: undecaprenyl-diphosphate phosphatase [unclassified Fusobacterium]MBR8701107.1 Undecaprenyl-diphosphatase [Fusobacterium sp. DD45]MBR8710913.1 Undecaprenyl-diphosphatase [Fusobacterium sp. DD28]MBR8748524.1 Undecaprenyl-diphosphatase [Fusobacterium sp. DD29]MBR8751473.1 Undecaprenyl-diphosphatase [Fusobacterium sp. DD26]MBR8760791.1 Undecaprenyl-diphosphatase [Fusobacterium sp. DD25]
MSPILLVIILAVVEGMTEFLPVSSTGHMILVEKFLGDVGLSKQFMDSFLIIVQLGAILAVVIYFWDKLTPFVKTKKDFILRMRLWVKVIVGVLPAVVIGLLLDDYISEYFMGNVFVVATTLIFYGILLIVIEKYNKSEGKINTMGKLSYKLAFIIGFFQCLAMIPGTSRSGATIIGALLLGLSREVATEYSFFLAIPTMFGATFLKLIKNGMHFTSSEWQLIGIGTVIAFVVAYIVIKWFMAYIKKRDFVFFGVYRIILGIIVLLAIFI